jgi:hypothetical protein
MSASRASSVYLLALLVHISTCFTSNISACFTHIGEDERVMRLLSLLAVLVHKYLLY